MITKMKKNEINKVNHAFLRLSHVISLAKMAALSWA